MKRLDDFETRREHLKRLTDEELYERFWGLAKEVVGPLLKLGYEYTTPAIERSVLLRMGFSSLEAKAIVENAVSSGLMGKGCGNIVWRLSKEKGIGIRDAGLYLTSAENWSEAKALFAREAH